MLGNEVRRRFITFFEERGHVLVPSSSLIPPPDSGLLLTTAGMVQFLPFFLGQSAPPQPRAVSVQKSFRTTDIELVGHDARHMTFFEMLGNFSFGDYFKEEACAWAHELVTEGYGIDHDRLWVTAFHSDDEAVDIWVDRVGIPPERIVRRGKEDNYWLVPGRAGGPCSEIFVDRGSKYGPDGGPAVDEERFIEIWNLVFMQHAVDDAGNAIGDLPNTNIDTGSGLERVAIVLQEADTSFETDLLRPLLATAEELGDRKYGEDERADVSLRILAEHSRATAMLIADGVQPSNEGRGYVVRRMLRRVVSHARRLDIDRPVTEPLVDTCVEILGEAYPELASNRDYIVEVGASEEERFRATLRQGMVLFEDAVGRARSAGGTSVPGADAFRLHDTHGFPIELTRELAMEQGLDVDMGGFEALMEEQRRRAQESARRGGVGGDALARVAGRAGRTDFVGYQRLDAESDVQGLLVDGTEVGEATERQPVTLILSRSPFYAEGGGQVGDRGVVRTQGGLVRIEDTVAGPADAILHRGRVESGVVRVGDEVHAEVEREAREATMRSHTATHVVHWTLRHLLGEHARQAGSLVAPGRLRFDFSHHHGLVPDEVEEAELVANQRLAADDPVRAYETTMEYARSQGAIALFGEKYGDLVRVVEIGDYSRELCGGTHVPHTGRVAVVRILHEASIGSGMRRIEALVGPDALRHINVERRLLQEVVTLLGGGDVDGAPERARRAMDRIKQLESELGKLRKGDRAASVEELVGHASRVADVALVVAALPGEDASGLRDLAQAVRQRLERDGAGAVVLGSADGGGAKLAAACTKALVERGLSAQQLLEPAARAVGGGAGGKAILAMAGGREAGKLDQALALIPPRLQELLTGGSGG